MIRLIFYIVVGLIVLSFFGVSLQHLIENPVTQENFRYFTDLLAQGWNDLIALITAFLRPVLSLVG